LTLALDDQFQASYGRDPYTQNFKFKGQSDQKRVETNGRTDGHCDCIAIPVNAFGKYDTTPTISQNWDF